MKLFFPHDSNHGHLKTIKEAFKFCYLLFMLNILDMHVYLEMSGEVPRFCSILLRDLQPDKPSQMLIGVGGELMESYHHL